jgi:hypothetical protein
MQLKSTKAINWKDDIAILSGIRKSTVNYWMGLPVPVFIFWVDISDEKVYFCSVENHVRKKYPEFLDENTKTFSFEFYRYFEISNDFGNVMFKALYHKQRNFSTFTNNLQDLIFHFEEYNMHILENMGRDYFMFVDDREFLMTIHIYSICIKLSQFLGIKLKVDNLKDLIKKDKESWPEDEYCSTIHELAHDKLLRALYPLFCDIIKQSIVLITEQQKEYWLRNEYFMFQMCDQVNLSSLESF